MGGLVVKGINQVIGWLELSVPSPSLPGREGGVGDQVQSPMANDLIKHT